jgi:hypothetical protein
MAYPTGHLGTPEERFWRKVNKTETCWLWTAAKDRHGYGRFSVNQQRRAELAHRVAWELLRGPIPNGMSLDHDNPIYGCANPSCVRPDHLEPVLHNKNLQRRRGPAANNNSSGYRGVTWHKPRRNWLVRVMRDGVVHRAGSFVDLADAVAARDALYLKLFGHLPK